MESSLEWRRIMTLTENRDGGIALWLLQEAKQNG